MFPLPLPRHRVATFGPLGLVGGEAGMPGREEGALHTYSIGLERGSGAPTVQSLAHTLINDTIRPFTSTWHPRLAAYEARCPADTAPSATSPPGRRRK
ncbi:hypothetical protein AB0M61_36310 [Streptomyces sp. NPDC051642]|uniref:hypothetical protein n=1 Tax=Streptomyces sp. NPDC051642 TaxID=3154646 RepID=UPI0034403D88